ncbi:MAG: hypothetical protein KC421_03765 [Anaerolineales bacterium]|nr:hypothetical protein [Anaerolineales bacterium]
MNNKESLIAALYQADSLHNPSEIFKMFPEREIFALAGTILNDPEEGHLVGPTLIDAVRIGFDSLQQRDQIFNLLIFILKNPSLDSLIYRVTQRTILIHSGKWSSTEVRIFHTTFENNYLEELKSGDAYTAELSLEGNVLLSIYRKDDGLFQRSIGLLLTDPPPFIFDDRGGVDHLSVKYVKLLGHCFDYQPENPSIGKKFKAMLSEVENNPSVQSEVLYSIGICYLYDAFQANDIHSLHESLDQARRSFDEVQETEENRTDAALFDAIVNCYLSLLKPNDLNINFEQVTAYVRKAQQLLFDRLSGLPDDLPVIYSQAEFEIVRLASYLEQWVTQISEFPNQNPQLSLQVLARTYAAIRETDITSGLAYSALETSEIYVMLPYTASQFIRSKELVNQLQFMLSDESWKENATPLEFEFYSLVYDELSRHPFPKEEAATQLEQIRVAAEKEKPELAQSIKKWQERGLEKTGILENVIWEQLEQDGVIDVQTTSVQAIIKKLLPNLIDTLGKDYPHFREIRLALASIAHYFMWLYNTNATKSEKFLFQKPKGLGKDAKEQDLQNHFYQFTKHMPGIKCRLEESDAVPGRTDIMLSVQKTDFPIEVKKEEHDFSETNIHESYLAQAQTYATATAQVGFLFVLEVTVKELGMPLKDKTDYCHVDKITVPGTETPNCVCVFIFPGNRVSPSAHSWRK